MRLANKELTPMTTRFLITALFASITLAQQPALDRVLHITHAESDQQLQEIATDIRGITAIPDVSVDTAQKTLTLHGTAAQIAAAEWLLNQLDESAPTQRAENPAAHEYRLSGDDIVRVFHLANAPTPQALQEIATDVRSIANIRRLFTYTKSSAMTVRGDPSQIALSECW